jgi:hypothetical protein
MLHTLRLDFPYEFMGIKQDRFAVLFTKSIIVRGESDDILRCAYEVLDLRTQSAIHASCFS